MKVLAANRLGDGQAVWLSSDGDWTESIDGAAIARDRDEEARLAAAARAAMLSNEVLDAELVDVELPGGEIRPVRLRERIRAAGPTNRTDLGKQARPGRLSQAA